MRKPVEELLEDLRSRHIAELATTRAGDLESFWAILKARMMVGNNLMLTTEGAEKVEERMKPAIEVAKAMTSFLIAMVEAKGVHPQEVPLVIDLVRASVVKIEVEMACKHESWRAVLELAASLRELL